MEKGLFTKNLEKFLRTQLYEFSRGQRDCAIELVKMHYRQQNYNSGGPCLFCSAELGEYIVSTPHSVRGDEWFDKLRHKTFGTLETDTVNIKVSRKRTFEDVRVKVFNTDPKHLKGYSCDHCWEALNKLIDEAKLRFCKKEEENQLSQSEQSQMIYNQKWDIVVKKTKATIPQRFHALSYVFQPNHKKELAALDYQDFLRTFYWDAVRQYKLHQAKFKCQLCNTNGELHVHHKTYEHHGEEHNYLDDLIVLCRGCHSKFHNIEETE